MLRVEVMEAGQSALPAVDVRDAAFAIGSAPSARVRLPAGAVRAEHVRVDAERWRALAPVKIDGTPHDSGEIGDGVTLELGAYRVRIAPAPAGATASPVQRTESLARELMRNLLGTAGAPTLEIERGPNVGAKRMLAPPESVLVIGRGDEAAWVIDDKDLSRTHAEVRRDWDGARIVDLDSKNGTKVDGDPVNADGMALRDGCVVELGTVVLRFRDPAEKHLQAGAPLPGPRGSQPVPALRAVEAPRGSLLVFYAALTIMVASLAALIWVLSDA